MTFAILTGCGGLHVATQCGVFKGTTKEVFVDRREYDGPLWEQIEEAYQFVLRNIHLGATFEGIYRQDVYEIPPDAIRELIINAMMHRSYLDRGMIQVAGDNPISIGISGNWGSGKSLMVKMIGKEVEKKTMKSRDICFWNSMRGCIRDMMMLRQLYFKQLLKNCLTR